MRPGRRQRIVALGYRNHPHNREITNAWNGRMREETYTAPNRPQKRQLAGLEIAAATKAAGSAGRAGKEEGELAGREPTGSRAKAATEIQMMDSISDPEFSLAVEVGYHDARQFFFEAAHRWAMFATIVFGASAVAPFGPREVFGVARGYGGGGGHRLRLHRTARSGTPTFVAATTSLWPT